MRYLALITDYDATLASHNQVSEETVAALEKLRASGRRTILLTGRRLKDLLKVFPHPHLFDCIVGENGAVIYNPQTRTARSLANAPPKKLVQTLQARGVDPLDIGEVVLATNEHHRRTAQEVIWELGLEVQIIGNRGAVMLLPAGVNKASGMVEALRVLGLSRHEVVGIGDAENDHSFLARCECSVAVANAISSVKETVSFVTQAENGAGVRELIEEILSSDLQRMEGLIPQHLISLGTRPDGDPVSITPFGNSLLIVGPSSSGKSTLAAGIVERLIEKDYQICIIDPEGDYGSLPHLISLGNRWREPNIDEILSVLEDSRMNLAINLLGIPLEDRPQFFDRLLPHIRTLRARTGRPHWFVVDEAHHMLPPAWGPKTMAPLTVSETIFVTVHPNHVSPTVLSEISLVLAVGRDPERALSSFAGVSGKELHWPEALHFEVEHAVAWFVDKKDPFSLLPEPGPSERLRHHRKYAEGDLRWHSFYFRGPEGKLNLRAQNLAVFCQLADGVDDETWMYHLHRNDYSCWIRKCVRDPSMAEEVEQLEQRRDLSPQQSRHAIRDLICSRYTLPE